MVCVLGTLNPADTNPANVSEGTGSGSPCKTFSTGPNGHLPGTTITEGHTVTEQGIWVH